LGKRCLFCGRFFVPDLRVSERQKACPREGCKRARKRLSQRLWCKKNPDYFKDHYSLSVKPWRQRRRILEEDTIKDKRSSSKSLLRFTLLIPGDRVRMIKDEMDRAVRFDESGVINAGWRMRERIHKRLPVQFVQEVLGPFDSHRISEKEAKVYFLDIFILMKIGSSIISTIL